MADQKDKHVTLSIEELAHLLRQEKTEADPTQQKKSLFSGKMQSTANLELNLRDVVFSILRRWWLVAICTVLCVAVVFTMFFVNYTPKYTATAKMYVNNESISIGSTKVSVSTGDISASQSLVNTYCEILKTRLTLGVVIDELKSQYGYEMGYYDLLNRLTTGSVSDTEIFSITVVDYDPQRAIDTVNKIVNVLPNQIPQVIDGSSVRTVDRAQDARIVSAGFTRMVFIAAFLGFALSCFYCVLRGCIFNDIIESDDWLKHNYATIPILANVPNVYASGRHGGYGYYGKYGYGKYGYGYGYGYRGYGGYYQNEYRLKTDKSKDKDKAKENDKPKDKTTEKENEKK